MDKPSLELEPYEIPPQRQPDSDGEPFNFRAHWFGAERDFIGQAISSGEHSYHLWFCLADEPERGNFVCANPNHDRRPSCSPYTEFWMPPLEQFIKFIEGGFWGRFFVLDSGLRLADGTNGNCTIFLAASGWGRVNFPHQSWAEFQWAHTCPQALSEPEPIHHLDKIRALAQNPEHPFHFAFRWSQLSQTEQLTLAIPLRNGSYAEWRDIIRLYIIAIFPQEDGWFICHEVSLVSRAQPMEIRSRHDRHRMGTWAQRQEESGALKKLLEWTLGYFGPHREERLCEEHHCVGFWIRNSQTLFSGREAYSNQHERIEALVQLRGWLADKATPAEIEELLREEQ